MKALRKPLAVTLSEAAGIKKTEHLRVYAVGDTGKIIEQAAFKGLTAVFKTPEVTKGNAKLYIAGSIPKELNAGKITERQLIRAGAYSVIKNLRIDNEIIVHRLPHDFTEFLPFRFCRITGHLNKNFIIDSETRKLPVCDARVHICEVDPILILRPYIPDHIIIDIRDRFRLISDEFKRTGLIPKPVPEPIRPIEFKPKINLRTIDKKNSLLKAAQLHSMPTISNEVLQNLSSNSLEVVKESLYNNYKILYPYFCLWPIFWPWLYFKHEIATVYTDCNGAFEAWYHHFGNADQPDIYIWVEICINGTWTTVYRPSIPCHTRWNYVCGTDISITLTDPRIPLCVCDPLPGSIVWVKRAGNGTSIRRIALHAASGSTPSLFADCRGLTNSTGVEGNSYVSPFSQSFPLYVQFGSGFPSGAITHFRWKFRRIADVNLTPVVEAFEYQEGALSKSYTYQGTNADGDTVFYTGNFPLDVTLSSGKIYKIPHAEASVDTGISTAEWNQDTATIHINTADFSNGLYEFALELCDGAGNVQSVDDSVFQVDSLVASPPNPASTPAAGVNAAYVIKSGSLNTAFRFVMRMDNDETTCEIFDAVVANADGTGTTTDTICGFAEYKSKVSGNVLFRFNAEQPHGYAHFSFGVTKGNGVPGAAFSLAGQVPEPSFTQTINGSPVNYQGNPTIGSLLGSCTEAAFAENLYVTAYHTNGSVRLQQYDSSDVAAIALKPATTP